jgi:hypothetical protein
MLTLGGPWDYANQLSGLRTQSRETHWLPDMTEVRVVGPSTYSSESLSLSTWLTVGMALAVDNISEYAGGSYNNLYPSRPARRWRLSYDSLESSHIS